MPDHSFEHHTDHIALDLLPDGVVVFDETGTVRAVNRVAARMLGVDQRESLGQPAAKVLQPLVRSDGCTWLGFNALDSGLHTRTGVPEQSWLLPSGEEVLVAAALTRVPPERRTPGAPAGEVVRTALTLRSGRGRARLDKDRSDLVATVAHELRSPLTGVKGFVQALVARWDALNDEQKLLMLNTVNADADRLSRLITELLDVARIDTGRLSLHPLPTDVREISERIVASFRETSTRTITTRYEDGPPLLVDPDKLNQLLHNVIDNALRHGDGDVNVSLGYRPSAGRDILGVLQVRDQGAGIPADLRRRVVTKFWRHGSAGGSGLGLYIVNGLTRLHGGALEIDDAPGGGAVIRMVLPTLREDAS